MSEQLRKFVEEVNKKTIKGDIKWENGKYLILLIGEMR